MSRRTSLPILVAALTLAAGAARADGFQDSRRSRSTMLAAGWEASVPLERLRDHVQDPGYRGVQVEFRRGVARSLSLGIATSWTWLAQAYPAKQIHDADATISGPLYDRVRFATVRATAHWYLGARALQPYLGVGAGGVSYETYRSVGGSVATRSEWAPTVDPQVGFLWTVSGGAALHLQVRYQVSTAKFYGVEQASWLGVQLGLAAYR